MDHHAHAQYAVIEVQHRSKELQAFLGTVAHFRKVLPVVLEIHAQHDWDAEDELSIWDGIKAVCPNQRLRRLTITSWRPGFTPCDVFLTTARLASRIPIFSKIKGAPGLFHSPAWYAMGIDHRGLHVAVAEEFLDCPNVVIRL